MLESQLLKKLITMLGKKNINEKQLFKVLSYYKLNVEKRPLFSFYTLLSKERPLMKLLKVKKSGRRHELGIPISEFKSYSMALMYIYKNRKKGRNSLEYIYSEFNNLYNEKRLSFLIKERNEIYKVAIKNRVHLKLIKKIL